MQLWNHSLFSRQTFLRATLIFKVEDGHPQNGRAPVRHDADTRAAAAHSERTRGVMTHEVPGVCGIAAQSGAFPCRGWALERQNGGQTDGHDDNNDRQSWVLKTTRINDPQSWVYDMILMRTEGTGRLRKTSAHVEI